LISEPISLRATNCITWRSESKTSRARIRGLWPSEVRAAIIKERAHRIWKAGQGVAEREPDRDRWEPKSRGSHPSRGSGDSRAGKWAPVSVERGPEVASPPPGLAGTITSPGPWWGWGREPHTRQIGQPRARAHPRNFSPGSRFTSGPSPGPDSWSWRNPPSRPTRDLNALLRGFRSLAPACRANFDGRLAGPPSIFVPTSNISPRIPSLAISLSSGIQMRSGRHPRLCHQRSPMEAICTVFSQPWL
jgi:hypothetical protein